MILLRIVPKLNNYKIKYFFILIILSLIHAQVDYGINYELKYSNGKGDATDIFENYIDLNIYYNNLYYYSLIKYKDPALIGSPTKKIDDIYSIFYLEYSNDNFLLQVGDIFNSFGSGLSLHTFEDRTIDYNNAPRGINLLYYLRDNIDIFTVIGANTFSTRTNPAMPEPDIYIDNSTMSTGFSYQHEYFDIHYLGMINEQSLNSQTIVELKKLNNKLRRIFIYFPVLPGLVIGITFNQSGIFSSFQVSISILVNVLYVYPKSTKFPL